MILEVVSSRREEPQRFDAQGNLTDDASKEFIRQLVKRI